jgi:hypothetical protein
MNDMIWTAIESATEWHAMENPRTENGKRVPYSVHPVRVAR